MKRILVATAVVAFAAGCGPRGGQENRRESGLPVQAETRAATGLTVIRFSLDPPGTFEIVGTERKSLDLKTLATALAEDSRNHPTAEYEVYAEVKRPSEGPGGTDEIIDTIRAAGVTLRHYWAPVSDVDTERAKPGRYGLGHVDLLDADPSGPPSR